jgi:hypothetical protein
MKQSHDTPEIKRLKQELIELKSNEVKQRFEKDNDLVLHSIYIKDLKCKIQRLKRGEDI